MSSCGSTLRNGRARLGVRQRHLVGQFEHVGLGLGARPDVGLRRRRVEARQHRVDVVLIVAGDRLGRRRRRRRLRRGSRLRRRRDRRRRNIVVAALRRPASRRRAAAAELGRLGVELRAAGLASSSAMMRRIDARISSIEGSWTFAGCVISNSTSKPILHQATKELPVPDMQAGIFIAQARLVPRSSPPDASRGIRSLNATRTRAIDARTRRESHARPGNGMSWPQLIASKAPGARAPGDDVIRAVRLR